MKYLLPTVLTALLVSASCTTDRHDCKTPSLNLAANISAATSSPLKVSELSYALLSNDSAAAFFKDAVMVDVVGDTAVLVERVPDMSRLILYNLKDGQ